MCWHRWSNWIVIEEGQIQRVDDSSVIGAILIQKRSCAKCGKHQMNQQRTLL